MRIRKNYKYKFYLFFLINKTIVFGVKKDQSEFFKDLSQLAFRMTGDAVEADLYFDELREYINKNPKFLEENKKSINTFCKKTGMKL